MLDKMAIPPIPADRWSDGSGWSVGLPVQRFQSIRLGCGCHESKGACAAIKKDHLVDDPLYC
jgi:hypothetical protein